MAREDFLLYLDQAAGAASPRQAKNGVRLDPTRIEELLRKDGHTQWLSRRTVKGFDPKDYANILSDVELENLKRDVAGFGKVAESLGGKQKTTDQQIEDGLPHFLSMLNIMSPFLDGFNEYKTLKVALKQEKLPSYIKDFAVSVGEDWTGDPAIKIWVIIDDDAADESFYKGVSDLGGEIEEILESVNSGRHTFIYFRTFSEQRELEEAGVR